MNWDNSLAVDSVKTRMRAVTTEGLQSRHKTKWNLAWTRAVLETTNPSKGRNWRQVTVRLRRGVGGSGGGGPLPVSHTLKNAYSYSYICVAKFISAQ